MKYFIFTSYGEAFPIAYKLQEEGHDVYVGQVQNLEDLYGDNEASKPEEAADKQSRLSLYDNMVTKVPAWKLIEQIKNLRSTRDCFVFFDRNDLFKFASALKNVNIHGNFPTEEDYLLEQDRDEAKQFVRQHYPQLQVPTVKEFSVIEDAITFLKRTRKKWVLKGRGEAAKTYVPHTDDVEHAARQVIAVLEAAKEKYERGGFILEPMISSMIELTPGIMYYNGKRVAVLLNIENKPFGSGNTSFQTGCAQDLVFPTSFDDEINRIAFPEIVDQLAKKRRGLFYWDASLLIDQTSGDMYFGEFCPNRPGYNQIFSELAQLPTVSHYFESIKKKKNPFQLGTVASSVSIFNPDIDEETGRPPKDVPIDFQPAIEKDIWLWDTYRKRRRFLSAGDDKSLAVITGSGESLSEAVDNLYNNVSGFSFVGGYWRPKFDYLSMDYPTSILNRLNYGYNQLLYDIPFSVKIGG